MKLWPFWYILIKWNLPYFSTFFLIFFFQKNQMARNGENSLNDAEMVQDFAFSSGSFFVIFCPPPPPLSFYPLPNIILSFRGGSEPALAKESSAPPPKFSYSPLRKSRTAVVLLKFFWAPSCFALLLTRVAFRRAQNEDNWPIISWLTSIFVQILYRKITLFSLSRQL